MATAAAQRKWRAKNRFVKTQLNVMTRRLVHDDLREIAFPFAGQPPRDIAGNDSAAH